MKPPRMQFAGPGQSPGDYTNHEQSPDDLYLLRMITLRMQFAGPGQSPGDYTNHKQSPDDLYLLRMFSPRMQFARPGLLVRPSLFGIVSKNMCNIFIINQFIVASGLFHIAGIANSSISYFKWKNSSDVVQPFQKTVIKSF